MLNRLEGKKVIVLGLARSGLAAVRFLLGMGALVRATDMKKMTEIKGLSGIERSANLELYLGGHPDEILAGAHLLVISPGVNERIPFVKKAIENRIPVISELELAAGYIDKPLIAVTGTNGKTTTTTLIGEMLTSNGGQCVVAGNIGRAVSLEVDNINRSELGILETSSFQLAGCREFHSRGALILNVTPDHQDRHPTMADYLAAKAKIFENQAETDWTVLNFDDQLCRSLAEKCPGTVYYFSRSEKVEKGMFLENGWLVFKDEAGEKKIIRRSEIALEGLHNLENFLAASLAVTIMGVDRSAIRQVAGAFKGLAHRLETVATIKGVRFINDSKGTNIDAVRKSLLSFEGAPVILIMGGRDKGGDFGALKPLIKERVKSLVLLGEAAPKLAETFKGCCGITLVSSLAEGVKTAVVTARSGDIVLLSPGCTSWYMFRDYQERGDLFKKAVSEYGGKVCHG